MKVSAFSLEAAGGRAGTCRRRGAFVGRRRPEAGEQVVTEHMDCDKSLYKTYREGLGAMEEAARAEAEPKPVTDVIDFVVFRRAG